MGAGGSSVCESWPVLESADSSSLLFSLGLEVVAGYLKAVAFCWSSRWMRRIHFDLAVELDFC